MLWNEKETERLVEIINSQKAFVMDGTYKIEAWDIEDKHPDIYDYGTRTELFYQDSGVGEKYVMYNINKLWPDATVDEINGGCSSCGYGRYVTISIPRTKAQIMELFNATTEI